MIIAKMRGSAKAGKTAAALLVLISAPALSQQAPDAGSLLRQQPKPPAPAASPVPTPALAQPATDTPDTGPRVKISAVRIRGNTLIPEAELVARLNDLIGREASLGQLRRAALVLVGHYAQKGYLARVTLPPQEIKDGAVEYLVEEGRRGRVQVNRQGQRIDADRVSRFINERLAAGAPMDMAALGEALGILNDMPGAKVAASLAPGQGEREIDLAVSADDQPLLGYNLGLNNQGSRSTGVWQASAGVALANPSGRFDAASLLLNATEGTRFARGDYSLALADRGLRLGVNASAMRYELVQDSFAALQSSGTAQTAGLWLAYPVARRDALTLGLSGGLERKRLVDSTFAGEVGNRTVHVASFTVGGEATRNEGPLQGVTGFGASLTLGRSEQKNAAALAADQLGRRTQGSFTKLAWNLSLLRPLDAQWSLLATLRGQFADKNLDSSERFSLGGPAGVRGYPVSEGTGDAGWFASLSLTRPLGQAWAVNAFIDGGEVTVNRQPPPGAQSTPNRYGLAAGGLGFEWRQGRQLAVKAVLAAPIGHNPGAPADGSNNDGSPNNARAWLSLAAQF